MSAHNQRFAVSIHILTILAASQDTAVTSEAMATSVGTNPVVIRRTMSRLRQCGLVDSRPGTSGGWRLARAPQQISLCDVLHASDVDPIFVMHEHPDADCLIGGNIRQVLGGVFGRAQGALDKSLEQCTIADVLQDVLNLQKGDIEP
jgi:Rrf2 family protein